MTEGNQRPRPGARRLIYLTDAQIPGSSAPGLQAVRMCDAFAHLGVDVTLVAPRYRLSSYDEQDVKSFYGLRHEFKIRRHPIPIDRRLMTSRYRLAAARFVSYLWSLVSLTRKTRPEWVYGRSPMGLWIASRMRSLTGRHRIAVYGELHDLPNRAAGRRLLGQLNGVVAISGTLRDEATTQGMVAQEAIRVEPNGFDSGVHRLDQATARRLVCGRWPIDPTKPLLVYVGRVDSAKGGTTLLKLARGLPSVQMLMVGHVWEEALLERGNHIENVEFTGHIPPGEISTYLDAATILLLPSTARLSYAEFMSPLKLPEYMAAGRPIIASDLPSIGELLVHEANALLVPAEDADAWVTAVRRLVADPELATSLGERARLDAQGMSWDDRASRILGWLEQRSG